MATPPKNPTDGTTPPAPRKPATPRKTTTRKAATPGATKAPARKPAAPRTAAAKPATTPKPAARKPATKRTATVKAPTPAPKPSRKWGIAAAVGTVTAALTAGLLALRGSTPKKDDVAKPNEGKTAHQTDGTDSSASFQAGIADEGTIPE